MKYRLYFDVEVPEPELSVWKPDNVIEHAMACCFYVLWGHDLIVDPAQCTFEEVGPGL